MAYTFITVRYSLFFDRILIVFRNILNDYFLICLQRDSSFSVCKCDRAIRRISIFIRQFSSILTVYIAASGIFGLQCDFKIEFLFFIISTFNLFQKFQIANIFFVVELNSCLVNLRTILIVFNFGL